MKSIHYLSTLFIAALLSCITVRAETPAAPLDSKSAAAAAETFFAAYIKELSKQATDHTAWVAKTKLATPEFKASFKKAMADKNLEVDPVIDAQDVPITPFKAESTHVKGDAATVLVAGKYNEKEISRLQVTLVAKDGHWLIAKIARPKK